MTSLSLWDNATCNDVFLSFRGEDTRDSFTDHLYHALGQAGFLTFRDNDEIDRGQELKPEIERAIKASKSSIVVLSENYATSTWCLDELWLIIQQKRERNHFVLPVFYHVDPSDVRNQNGTFKIQVETCAKWTHDNVKRWKAALTDVANLTGSVLSGPETKFLKEIVDTIYKELDRKEVHLPSNLTGMDTRYEEITSWLCQSNLEYLAICGMGGSGKTTLAKYIYNSNWKKFENTSFVENIGRRCKESHDLLEPQKQLLKDILGGRKRKIPSVSQGTRKIAEALQTKRTLIVLDDIVEERQLVALLGTGKINAESKIIITTENSDKWFKFSSTSCQQYKMKLLNYDESVALLSRHAFGSEIPKEGFKDLATQAVKYCEGNPLALEVLGSSLSNSNTIPYWKSQLGVLTKDIHSRIQDVLKRGYDLLPYPSEKELFLHIACFFVGKDMDYVEKILEPDYAALSGIKTLIDRCLLSVSPNNKLMMHRLLQEMGRNIVREESLKHPAARSRVWLNGDSYKILKRGKGSESIEGLTLDMEMLREEERTFKLSDLKTDAFKDMDKLKLLQLNFVELAGSHENFSEDLRWLCWFGFHLRTIPSGLYMGNVVAIDMSYSNLEAFDPPMVLHSLKILNLKDSHNLLEIRNMSWIPYLETLILWNCHNLVRVYEIGDLKSLAQLNMTGCKNLCEKEQKDMPVRLKASSSGGVTEQPPFSFPHSLQQLFLNNCNLECTDSFPLSFSVQPFLRYLNLSNGLFEFLPCYNHLINLRVLDLSFCSSLKWLLSLPNTLAELYVYYCKSLEKITFQSPRFMLQEFGYEGCINLAEIEGFIKLLPIAKLDETDLGHLKWLKKYQSYKVLLVGDDELTIGRSLDLQMLYEFNIMSTSLPDIKDSRATPEYISVSPSLSFDVPSCPKNRRLKGLNVSFKYTLSGDDWPWFAKVSTTNGVDLMYNPKVFGKLGDGEVGIWLSYWPIGSTLEIGDTVNVSIAVISGLEVHECGATLVYSDDEIAKETLENNMGWEEVLGGDLSGFQLSTGAYYLCRRDFFELMEVERLTPDWFRILVGDTIDYTEVRGWRKTGRPKQSNPSFTELKTVRCIIHGPGAEEIYNLAEMSKSSLLDKTIEFTSSILEETLENVDEVTKIIHPLAQTKKKEQEMISEIIRHVKSFPLGKFYNEDGTPDISATKRLFERIDLDHDNFTSHPELKRLIMEVNFKRTPEKVDEEIAKLIQHLDTSVHQGIDEHEFVNGMKNLLKTYIVPMLPDASQDKSDSYSVETMGMSKAFISDKTTESTSIPHKEKFNNPLQPASKTIFRRMLDMIGFPSKEENSAQGDSELSSRRAEHNMLQGTREVPADDKVQNLKEFSFADLKRATSNFSSDLHIGEYLGWVDMNTLAPSTRGVGMAVAVKRLNEGGIQGRAEWLAEVSFLGRLAHPNIARLLGYCKDEHESLLVYEYLENGRFDRFLFTDATPPLSWGTRLMIMIGVARGLTYLHSSEPQVMCRDVKSSNILLDQDFNAKLEYWGLTGLGREEMNHSTMVMGSYVYAAPEYIASGHVYVKSVIYSFGVVLLETLTGQRSYDPKRPKEPLLVDWAKPNLTRKKKLKGIIDPRLERNYPLEAALKCAKLILRCIKQNPWDRPSSEEVLQRLEQIYAINK